jgi:hypothetical protein
MEVMRNPRLMRAFREGRKVSCNPAQQGVEFKLCRSQQFALRNYLMISFVSSHGHRGLLATEERRRRLAQAGVRRKPRLKQSRRGAFVGKVKDVDGCVLHSPKTRWGFGHPVPASLALCAPIVWVSRSGVAPEALWIKPRLEIIPPPL